MTTFIKVHHILSIVAPDLLGQPKSCPSDIKCVPPIQCPAHLKMIDSERPVVCSLYGDYKGFCCLTGQNHTTESYVKELESKRKQRRSVRDTRWSQPIDLVAIRDEANVHFHQLNTRTSRALANNHASFHHSFSSSGLSPFDLENQNLGVQHAIASRIARERQDILLLTRFVWL